MEDEQRLGAPGGDQGGAVGIGGGVGAEMFRRLSRGTAGRESTKGHPG